MMTTMLQLAQSAKAREALAAQQALDDEEDEQSSEAQSEEPPAYSGRACFCLEVDNPLRERCISFIEWP